MLVLPVLAFLWPDFQLRRRLRPRKLQDVDLLPQVKIHHGVTHTASVDCEFVEFLFSNLIACAPLPLAWVGARKDLLLYRYSNSSDETVFGNEEMEENNTVQQAASENGFLLSSTKALEFPSRLSKVELREM